MKQFNQFGFTLLEVLIAVTITAIIGIGASQLLMVGVDTQDSLEVRSNEIKNLQRLDLFLRKDLGQLAGRKYKNVYLTLNDAVSNQGDDLIDFSYSGIPANTLNTEHKISNILRASYSVQSHNHEYCADAIKSSNNKDSGADNCLVRLYWPVLDATSNTQPIIQVLIDSVTEAYFSFRGVLIDPVNNANSVKSNDWQEDWPPFNMSPDMIADLVQVKFIIVTESFGEITRIYEVPRFAYSR